MLKVGLTGGIGSGKSAVSDLLRRKNGVVVVDADAIAREVVAPGQPGLAWVVSEFGTDIVTKSGELDRKKLASIVFKDTEKLAKLNGILHPLIRERIMDTVLKWESEARYRVGILVVPLLAETGRERYPVDKVVVVDVDEDTALKRLIDKRGMTEAEAKSRIANQMKRSERLALADYVIPNSGSWDEMEVEVGKFVDWLTRCSDHRE